MARKRPYSLAVIATAAATAVSYAAANDSSSSSTRILIGDLDTYEVRMGILDMILYYSCLIIDVCILTNASPLFVLIQTLIYLWYTQNNTKTKRIFVDPHHRLPQNNNNSISVNLIMMVY